MYAIFWRPCRRRHGPGPLEALRAREGIATTSPGPPRPCLVGWGRAGGGLDSGSAAADETSETRADWLEIGKLSEWCLIPARWVKYTHEELLHTWQSEVGF